ncbi:MAG: hypothetical protein ABIF77_14670, partial [bacterium]
MTRNKWPRSTAGLLPLLCLTGSLFCLLAGPDVVAGPSFDPFLERFRVGDYRAPDDITLEGGWPADLFQPLQADSTWRLGVARYLAALDSSENHQLLTRLIVWPALGSETERNTWRTGVENGLARILQLEVVGPDTLPPLAGNHLFFHDYCQAYAVTCYEHARYLQSVSAIASMLDHAAELDLSDEEIFVWSLRLRQLQEQQAATKPRTDEPIWPEMFELGSFDSRSAWAIWVAQRRQRQLPAIPPKTGNDKLACWLGGLGEAWVLDQEIEDAGFALEARAGLGAATLAKGPQLTAFFKSYSTPPASYTFQRFWVHGQRRAAGYSADTTEAMARLTGL